MEGAAGSQQMKLFSPTHNTKMTLGNSWDLFTESDIKLKNEGNSIWDTLGYYRQKVLGNVKIEGGGDCLNLFLGVKHDSVVGSRTEITGGFKSEVTYGACMEKITGLKIESVKGAVYNKSTAKEVDSYPNAMKVIKGQIKEKAGNILTNVGGKIRRKAVEFYSEGTKMFDKCENMEEQVSGSRKIKTGKMLMKVSGPFVASGTSLKLSGKADINDGALKITK